MYRRNGSSLSQRELDEERDLPFDKPLDNKGFTAASMWYPPPAVKQSDDQQRVDSFSRRPFAASSHSWTIDYNKNIITDEEPTTYTYNPPAPAPPLPARSTTREDREQDLSAMGKARIDRELRECEKYYDEWIVFVDRGEVEKHLVISAMINGPVASPYEGGMFLVEICLSADYPFAPPRSVTFKRATYHPNIDEVGRVNAPFLEMNNWTPATSLVDLLHLIHDMLSFPQVDLNKGQGDPIRGLCWEQDEEAFNEEARMWTIKYNM